MLTILYKLLDFIFPPRDTQQRVRELSYKIVSPLYSLRVHESIHYLLPYQTETVRALIKENKFYGNTQAAALLAGTLAQYLKETPNRSVVLVPIPLSTLRKKTRGYNQVEQILRQLPPLAGVTINTAVLSRTKDTLAQTTLQRQARLKNMKGAFIAKAPKDLFEQCTIVIIDDVVTTGATLRAARASLVAHLHPSATIICLALAH